MTPHRPGDTPPPRRPARSRFFICLSQSSPVTPHSFLSVRVNAANKSLPESSARLLPPSFLQFAFCRFPSRYLPAREAARQTLFAELAWLCRPLPARRRRDAAAARGEQTRAPGQGCAEAAELGTSHLPAEGPSGYRPAPCPFPILRLFKHLQPNQGHCYRVLRVLAEREDVTPSPCGPDHVRSQSMGPMARGTRGCSSTWAHGARGAVAASPCLQSRSQGRPPSLGGGRALAAQMPLAPGDTLRGLRVFFLLSCPKKGKPILSHYGLDKPHRQL